MLGVPDKLDRLAQALIIIAAVIALANGFFMLTDPFGWYQMIDTVRFTGPPNQHFIRDIGLAYIISGAILAFAAKYPQGRWLAALAGSLWLGVHGALHIWEVMTGICAPDIFWRDAPGVLGPPLLVWIAIGILLARQKIAPAGLPDGLLLGAIEQMSRGEFEYMREVSRAPGRAFEKLKHMMPATQHRHVAPADLFHMARIGATLIEDCGPCALTAARGALADGLARNLVNQALSSAVPDGDLKTAFDFGQAIASQSADALMLGDVIEARHGRPVRLELAMTAATVRAYPAMKRGLGLTKSCSITKLEV